MRRGADVVERGHMGAVVDRRGERAPDEELIETAIPTIRIAADEIDVQALEIGGGIDLARDRQARKILDVPRKQSLDAVGEGLADGLGPASVRRRRNLAGRVALDEARRLRQLQPEDRLAFGRPRRIERGRLTHADRRLRRQEAALGFVGRTGYAVEAGRHMQESDLTEIAAALPARRRLQRIVDL